MHFLPPLPQQRPPQLVHQYRFSTQLVAIAIANLPAELYSHQHRLIIKLRHQEPRLRSQLPVLPVALGVLTALDC